MDAVELEKVYFAYRSRPDAPVLDSISLSVRKGDFVGVVGCTGAGKSTLLYCMNCVIPSLVEGKFGGSVRVNGEGAGGKTPAHFAGKVGLLFQDPDSQLFAPTVQEEISFGLENLGIGNREKRIRDALATVGLSGFESSDPCELSFGQRQKVAFASILAMDPDIFLLDEPVSALDWRSASEIYQILSSLNKKGKTIIAVEHNTEILAEYAHRIVMLRKGKIALDLPPEKFFSHPLVEKSGLKIPCSIKIGKELGIPNAVTPAKLSEKLGKGRKR